MSTVTKEVTCPACEQLFDVDIDTDPDATLQDVDCPECNAMLVATYDQTTGTVTLEDADEYEDELDADDLDGEESDTEADISDEEEGEDDAATE